MPSSIFIVNKVRFFLTCFDKHKICNVMSSIIYIQIINFFLFFSYTKDEVWGQILILFYFFLSIGFDFILFSEKTIMLAITWFSWTYINQGTLVKDHFFIFAWLCNDCKTCSSIFISSSVVFKIDAKIHELCLVNDSIFQKSTQTSSSYAHNYECGTPRSINFIFLSYKCTHGNYFKREI